jgi:16S rRNA (uracil1498-N3)-methyltransferase
MRLTRNYVPDALCVGGTLPLPEDVAVHLLRVLRLQVGDTCVLFNGDGHDYDARITQLGKRDAQVQIIAQRRLANESPLRITLLQGVARGEKMDWILQKATELGAAQFLPVFSERSEVKLDGPRADKRLAHWRAVVVAACEQSGRATVPEVAAPLVLAQALAQAAQQQGGPAFLLDPLAESSLMDLRTQGAQQLEACTLAIGPEGGWSPRDREQLHAAGFQGVRLGPRILRTETAGLAAIAALQFLAGDFQ